MTRAWTPQQQAVFDFVAGETGHGVVSALAGSGKTSTLVESIRYVKAGARVLCLAFNVRIADHLRPLVPAGVSVRTLHSFGREVLRAYPSFRVFEHSDTKDRSMVEKALEGTRYAKPAKGTRRGKADPAREDVVANVERGASLVKATLVRDAAGLEALVENFGLSVEGVSPAEMADWIARAVYASLAAWPQTSFDDEVWLPVHHGLALGTYDVVYLDEVQDVSVCQYTLAKSTLAPRGRLIAFGDVLQTVYSWRGADHTIFDRMKSELGAREMPLTVTWRCPRKVVELAQRYAPAFEAAPGASEGTVETISAKQMCEAVRPGDVILSRLNAPLPGLALRLMRRGVQAKITGSRDYAGVLKRLVARSKAETLGGLCTWLEGWKARELERAQRSKNAKAAAALVGDKFESLDGVIAQCSTVDEVLRQLDRMFVGDKADNAVILSSVHRFKGEESKRVFLLKETFFLKWGNEEEERRIHYVGITRAIESLIMVVDLRDKKMVK